MYYNKVMITLNYVHYYNENIFKFLPPENVMQLIQVHVVFE
jgi:hypothetical protein